MRGHGKCPLFYSLSFAYPLPFPLLPPKLLRCFRLLVRMSFGGTFGGGTEKGERGVRPRWEVCKRLLGEINNLFGLRIAKIIGLPFSEGFMTFAYSCCCFMQTDPLSVKLEYGI